jgi:hypothetical protein
MSETNNNQNLEYSAQSILNGVHRSDSSVRADVKILIENVEKVGDEDIENVRYALKSLGNYFEGGGESNLSKRDDEIFAHYVKDKFSN